MIAKHGEGACDKEDCKKAIRLLIDSGRCVYSYLGGSYIQLPPKAGRRILILVGWPVANVNAPSTMPRLVIAGLSGGSGKTLVSLGLLLSAQRRGLTVACIQEGARLHRRCLVGLGRTGRRPQS